MSRRRAIVVAALALGVVLLHLVLVRLMAHGHVAHVLLGAGNSVPPIGAAGLAIGLVMARFAAIVIAPGALMASGVSLLAHAVVGPKGEDGGGYRGGGGGGGSGTSSGTGMRSGEEGSGAVGMAAGTGWSIEGRGM